MTSLHTLLTALIRLMGIYYVFKAVDMTLTALIYYTEIAATADLGVNMQKLGLIYILALLIFAVLMFILAPKLAKLMVGKTEGARDVDLSIAVIFCAGVMIIAWGVAKIADMIHRVFYSSSVNPDGTSGKLSFDLSTTDSVYFLTSGLMILGGAMVIIKRHKILAKCIKSTTEN